jgi:hypothetical protein
MSEFCGRNPYMDYRNAVPFVNLSGYIINKPTAIEEKPATSLQEHLLRKKFIRRINVRRMLYKVMCEEYRNGRR